MIFRKKRSAMKRKEILTGYLMISPLLIGLGVFFVYSFFINIFYSMTNKKTFGAFKFVGARNFEKLFASDKFWLALGNTFKYVLICVPLVIIVSLLLAILLNRKVPGTGVYRTLIFLPAVTMPAAIGLIWKWIFNYEFGAINAVIGAFGGDRIAWLSDKSVVLYAVATVLVWADVSLRMIVFLAGLQGIPAALYEAAEIDGASETTRLFRITLPLLSPTIFFAALMEMIGVFQIFDFIYLMISPNSAGLPAARSLVAYFYDEAFVRGNHGYGSAITVVLFAIILLATALQLYLQKKWVYQEG